MSGSDRQAEDGRYEQPGTPVTQPGLREIGNDSYARSPQQDDRKGLHRRQKQFWDRKETACEIETINRRAGLRRILFPKTAQSFVARQRSLKCPLGLRHCEWVEDWPARRCGPSRFR
jgi:hypothetical protein